MVVGEQVFLEYQGTGNGGYCSSVIGLVPEKGVALNNSFCINKAYCPAPVQSGIVPEDVVCQGDIR